MRGTLVRFLSVTFLSVTLVSINANAVTGSIPAEDADFSPVVNIRTEQLQNGEKVPGYCVGTVVHPRVIISAAHCWASTYQIRDDKLNYTLGKYIYKTMPDGKVKRIGYKDMIYGQSRVQFYFTRSLTSRLNQNGKVQISPDEDIAVAVLTDPVEKVAEYGTTPVISQAELNSIMSQITRYSPTVVSTNIFADMSSTDTKRKAVLNNLQKTSVHLKSNSTSRVEEGDSGAPVLVKMNNQWKLAAVVKGRAETFFSNWDVFTLADKKICEISNQIPDKEIQSTLCH